MKDYPFEYYCKWCGKPFKRRVPDGDMRCTRCRIGIEDSRALIRVLSFYNAFYSHGRRKKNG